LEIEAFSQDRGQSVRRIGGSISEAVQDRSVVTIDH